MVTLLLLASSVAGWSVALWQRRCHARELRRLKCQHEAALAQYGCHRFAQGLNLAKERRRTAQDWQEASR